MVTSHLHNAPCFPSFSVDRTISVHSHSGGRSVAAEPQATALRNNYQEGEEKNDLPPCFWRKFSVGGLTSGTFWRMSCVRLLLCLFSTARSMCQLSSDSASFHATALPNYIRYFGISFAFNLSTSPTSANTLRYSCQARIGRCYAYHHQDMNAEQVKRECCSERSTLIVLIVST